MSRRLILIAALASPAHADDAAQAIGAELGVASGGHLTGGGLRVAGHYTYQLSSTDWFDGSASFTFGGGTARCFLDRGGHYVCDHGLVDGKGGEIGAAVRRMFAAQQQFRPFARVGVGLGIVRFSDDAVTGALLTLHAGGGVRADVADQVAIVIDADLAAGAGAFGHGIGLAPQLGFAIMAGVEFKLQ